MAAFRSASGNSGGSMTGPGRMQLTRTFGLRVPSSTASVRVSADRDDRAAGLLPHHRQADPLAAEERAECVGFEVAADVGRGHVFERLRLPNRGRIDQHIDPAEAGEHILDQPLDRLLIRQIGAERFGVGPVPAEISDRFGGVLGRSVVVNRQGISAAGQSLGDVPADAAFAAAGDEGDGGGRRPVHIFMVRPRQMPRSRGRNFPAAFA